MASGALACRHPPRRYKVESNLECLDLALADEILDRVDEIVPPGGQERNASTASLSPAQGAGSVAVQVVQTPCWAGTLPELANTVDVGRSEAGRCIRATHQALPGLEGAGMTLRVRRLLSTASCSIASGSSAVICEPLKDVADFRVLSCKAAAPQGTTRKALGGRPLTDAFPTSDGDGILVALRRVAVTARRSRGTMRAPTKAATTGVLRPASVARPLMCWPS